MEYLYREGMGKQIQVDLPDKKRDSECPSNSSRGLDMDGGGI